MPGLITNTWRCYRCKKDYSTFMLAGAKYVYAGGYRRRICAGCASESQIKIKSQAGNRKASVETITAR